MIDINATLIAQILNFLILVGILRAFAYKPVVRMLKARQDRIQESLNKADADVAEADKLLAAYKAKLAEANAKAETIVMNAEKRASEEREAKRAEMKREIEQMRKAAQAEIAREREHAVEQMRAEMITLSMAQPVRSLPRISINPKTRHSWQSLSINSTKTRLVICHAKHTACTKVFPCNLRACTGRG